MESNITAERIANAICQDTSFNGHVILIEGKKDLKTYKKFTSKTEAKLVVTFGKHKMRDAYSILTSRKFDRKLGIRDADFLRIPGNTKFSENYDDHIFPTDGHDAEIMMIRAGSLSSVLDIVSDEEKVSSFRESNRRSVENIVFDLIRPLGYLRLANKRHNLGLSFKPAKPDGNRLRLDRFICREEWKVNDLDKMINYVIEYSKNRGNAVASRDAALAALIQEMKINHPDAELLNGHDASEAFLLVAKQGLSSKNKLLQDANCIEDLLSSCFDWLKFSTTALYAELNRWQSRLAHPVFIPT